MVEKRKVILSYNIVGESNIDVKYDFIKRTENRNFEEKKMFFQYFIKIFQDAKLSSFEYFKVKIPCEIFHTHNSYY